MPDLDDRLQFIEQAVDLFGCVRGKHNHAQRAERAATRIVQPLDRNSAFEQFLLDPIHLVSALQDPRGDRVGVSSRLNPS